MATKTVLTVSPLPGAVGLIPEAPDTNVHEIYSLEITHRPMKKVTLETILLNR